MKNVFSYVLTFLISICCFSCTESNTFYSCDPDADSWAKANLIEIRQMTRTEWEDMNNPLYQQAAYVAFSPEQKTEFWNIKLDIAMELDWSKEEKVHISSLKDYINNDPLLFVREEPTDDFYIYVHNWIEYAKEELKWEQTVIWSILMSGYNVIDKKGNTALQSSNVNTLRDTREVSCNCHQGNIMWTTCSSLTNKYCKAAPCDDSVHGCGAIWVESCNGVCSY